MRPWVGKCRVSDLAAPVLLHMTVAKGTFSTPRWPIPGVANTETPVGANYQISYRFKMQASRAESATACHIAQAKNRPNLWPIPPSHLAGATLHEATGQRQDARMASVSPLQGCCRVAAPAPISRIGWRRRKRDAPGNPLTSPSFSFVLDHRMCPVKVNYNNFKNK